MTQEQVNITTEIVNALTPFGGVLTASGILIVIARSWVKRVDDRLTTIHEISNAVQLLTTSQELSTRKLKHVEFRQRRHRAYVEGKLDILHDQMNDISDQIKKFPGGTNGTSQIEKEEMK